MRRRTKTFVSKGCTPCWPPFLFSVLFSSCCSSVVIVQTDQPAHHHVVIECLQMVERETAVMVRGTKLPAERLQTKTI